MKISIDTKEDSHDEIRKVIGMLQNILGDSQPIFSNQPSSLSAAGDSANASPFANIFGDSSASHPAAAVETAPSSNTAPSSEVKEEISQSTEDLFAELFSEEELKKMDDVKKEEDEEEEVEIKSKSKSKRSEIEFY